MKRVCVYCGSAGGRGDVFRAMARNMGTALAERGLGLVYGGASIGLMGEVADAALAGGTEVIGVIPSVVQEREIAHTGLTRLLPCGGMHERKTLMASHADAFVAMPGGLGTLEELFEILTWAQLGMHQKPVGLLNGQGYYDRLIGFLDHCVAEELIQPRHRALMKVADDTDTLLDQLGMWGGPED